MFDSKSEKSGLGLGLGGYGYGYGQLLWSAEQRPGPVGWGHDGWLGGWLACEPWRIRFARLGLRVKGGVRVRASYWVRCISSRKVDTQIQPGSMGF